ncbi:MAG: DUF4142 domain-containing protein [Bacteroidales bacterium]|nr:DUF4142 domain-containing protein [Bacteroidales bacterium]
MRKTNYIKGALLQVTFVATILLVASCGFNQQTEDTKDIAEEQNEEKFDNNKQENDAQFLVNAAEINLEEIQLGQLAQQKGSTTQVKELGKMMEDAHTKSLNDIAALAKSKMISIPTSATNDAKDTYTKLNDKSGNDFDNAYVDLMVSKHKDAIDTYNKASTDGYDSEIKNWATTSLVELRKHLDHSVNLQNNLTAHTSQKN